MTGVIWANSVLAALQIGSLIVLIWLVLRVKLRNALAVRANRKRRRLAPLILIRQAVLNAEEIGLLFPELAGEDAAALSESDACLGPVTQGEKVLGVVQSEMTRRLLIYSCFYRRRMAECGIKANYGSEDERSEARENCVRFKLASEALNELMFLAARHELGLWDELGIGIRFDWKIVAVRNRQVPEFLRGLIGDEG